MIDEFVSALSGAIVFIINQDYYPHKKALAAFISSFFMGVFGGEFATTILKDYTGLGGGISIELSSFLTSAFILPICRVLYGKISRN